MNQPLTLANAALLTVPITLWAGNAIVGRLAAGLVPTREEYQAQRNGFRLQLREFAQPVAATAAKPDTVISAGANA